MTERVNTWLDRLKNPALFMALLGTFYWVSIRLDKVDTLERRLEKKITIQNEHHKKMDEMKNEYLKEVKILEIKIKELEVKVEYLESK